MGIQSLQEFVENSGLYSLKLSTFLEYTSRQTSNLLIIHVDTCLRSFYHENIDWVCGGQWSELFQNVERFVRAFRQCDIELIVFFDGTINNKQIYNWATKHKLVREVVRDTISLVNHNSNVPFRSKTRTFVPPGSLNTALRLAFRACDVFVCSSIEDSFKEILVYCKEQNAIGVIANNSNYLLCKFPQYISIGSTRWMKKIISNCSVYKVNSMLTALDLVEDDLPYFAGLLGNYILNDTYLSSFFWDLIEDDNPLKKVKDNLSNDAVLPPSEMRLKCVAKFVSENREKLQNLDELSKIVFKNCEKLTPDEGKEKLVAIVSYYKDVLQLSQSNISNKSGNLDWSIQGFPLHNTSSDIPNTQHNYKKTWRFTHKTRQLANNIKTHSGTTREDKETSPNIDDPEKVLKEGTLEEAAQALEQLERNESEAELNIPKDDSADNSEKEREEEEEEQVIENEEKPSVLALHNSDGSLHFDVDEDYQESAGEYEVQEIKLSPILPSIEREVLDIAQKRHQCGQMCPEVLNLLTHGEILINMTIDDEVTRLPIPLIYRPLRQCIYGVLFGAKQEQSSSRKDKENSFGTREEDRTVDHNNEENSDIASKEEDAVGTNNKTDDIKTKGEDDVTVNEQVEENNAEENNSADHKDEPAIDEEEDDESENNTLIRIKEWCVYNEKSLDEPDLVSPKGMSWGVPSLKNLWLGTNSEDNANRLKAFLSCMRSDTVNMSNTAMVPQRVMLLCCVLRYLIQQDPKKSILTKQDIDAFLAQALSPDLTTEHNTQNFAHLKLNRVDSRCVQLAAIFMSGIENAIIANDACGSPVPWEFCCPWNFFDGKLFHSKWLQSTMSFSPIDLCDGKPHIAEKLERLRWCVTEGLDGKYMITGLEQTKKFISPFGSPLNMQQRPYYGVMRPAGSVPIGARGKSRGPASRRAVHGSGGILHVAGVPVAHWGGNKSGFGYSRNAPTVLVGGPNSVDLPSDHKRGIRGGSRKVSNRGRGLLETPYVSPWQHGYGYEDVHNESFQRYMKGVQKAEQVRSNIRKMQPTRPHLYNFTQTNPQQRQQQQQNHMSPYQNNQHSRKVRPLGYTSNYKPESYTKNMWIGKGRGQQQTNNDAHSSYSSGPQTLSSVNPTLRHQSQQNNSGRGQWTKHDE